MSTQSTPRSLSWRGLQLLAVCVYVFALATKGEVSCPLKFNPAPPRVSFGGPTFAGARLALADLNRDGHLDAVSASTSNAIAWFRNNGSGIFGSSFRLVLAGGGSSAVVDLLAHDVSGDQVPDVLASFVGFAGVLVMLNNGTGGFPFAPLALPSAGGRVFSASLAVADVNNDAGSSRQHC